jgi:hypothetical protein
MTPRNAEYGPRAIESGLNYLQSFKAIELNLRPDLQVSTVVARWILHNAEAFPEVYDRCMSTPGLKVDLCSSNTLLIYLTNLSTECSFGHTVVEHTPSGKPQK